MNTNGIIIVNKPKDWTSHDVVAKIRCTFGRKVKVGHTGTLDPMATGVLPICIGSATKLSDIISGYEKAYKVKFELGYETDTEDCTGNILNKVECIDISHKDIKDAILSFIGEYDQIPPMYSAIKINGRRLYEIAREGKEIDRKSRKINIFKIYDIVIDNNIIEMTVDCSKGTYIRSLCRDIGRKLGTYATMTDLVRVKVGNIEYKSTVALSDINVENIDKHIISIEKILDNYPKIKAKKNVRILLDNGNPINIENILENVDINKEYLLYNDINELIGIFYIKDSKLYPKIMLKR